VKQALHNKFLLTTWQSIVQPFPKQRWWNSRIHRFRGFHRFCKLVNFTELAKLIEKFELTEKGFLPPSLTLLISWVWHLWYLTLLSASLV